MNKVEHFPTLASPPRKKASQAPGKKKKKVDQPLIYLPIEERGSPQNKRYFLLLGALGGRGTCSSAVAGQHLWQRRGEAYKVGVGFLI